MSFVAWMAAVGVLLLAMALASAYLRRLPISTAIVYLGVGIIVGPTGLGWLEIDLHAATPWLERVTEVAVVVSLFINGLKLRAPVRAPVWRAAFLLAGPVMLVSIVGVALIAHLAFGLPAAAAVLLAAILAPTDPVLASAVAVDSARDRDRMRYGLSGEAGLNDGAAFPFVVLALTWMKRNELGAWTAGWFAHRLLWAIPAALVVGYVAGLGVGRLAIALRHRERDDSAPNDLLALALIALSYAVADVIGAWGFLSVFAAGVGLRRAEMNVVTNTPHPDAQPCEPENHAEPEPTTHPPAEDLVPAGKANKDLDQPAIAAGLLVAEVLSFGDTVERIMEVLLIVVIGACLTNHWDARAVPLALALFVVIRPVAVWAALVRSPTERPHRWLMGWFGVRGIGSLYYLTYALNQTGHAPDVIATVDLVVSVVALSIMLHGGTARPLLGWYERWLQRPAGAAT